MFDFSTHFRDYCVFHSAAIKLSLRGRSGGVAVLIPKTLLPYITRIECNCENRICFKKSEDLLGLDKCLLFVSLYTLLYKLYSETKSKSLSNRTNLCLAGRLTKARTTNSPIQTVQYMA